MDQGTDSFQRATGNWRKSSYSGDQGACVEVASSPRTHGVRDSRTLAHPPLYFTSTEWSAFVTSVKSEGL